MTEHESWGRQYINTHYMCAATSYMSGEPHTLKTDLREADGNPGTHPSGRTGGGAI